MSITSEDMAHQIGEEYGPATAEEFRRRIPAGLRGFDVSAGMGVLDGILAGKKRKGHSYHDITPIPQARTMTVTYGTIHLDKPTVEGAAKQIEREYSWELAQKFRDKFPQGDAEISYELLFKTLDEILLNGRKPIFPMFGPTNSKPCRGEVIFREDLF